jgi:phosphatidylethanolamine-binding protein (PEBP) family uncharacterized protein
MEVYFNNKLLKNNEYLTISETQIQPDIKLNLAPNKFYTLTVHDPDGVGGNHIHWAKINITNNDINTGLDIIPYKGPGAPPNSGIHHYIFKIYLQNGEELNIDPLTGRIYDKDFIKKTLLLKDALFEIQFRIKTQTGGKRRKRRTNKKRSKRSRKTRRY